VPNERRINRAKEMVHALGLSHWLLHGNEDTYNSPDKMTDEWHLHSFDLALLREISENILLIRQTKAVPLCFAPLRYVARCQVVE
jgi:hypothetical protein